VLYRVEVENFYSIREPQVIDLRVAASVPDIPGRFAPVWQGSEERVPKTIAIFGANASGKSTVLKIVAFLANFLLHSFAAPPTQRIMLDRFNDANALGQPARFAVELGGLVDLSGPNDPGAPMCRYRYELEIGSPGSEQGRVIRESLFYWPERAGKRRALFHRREDGTVEATKPFGLGPFRASLQTVLRPNASVVSTLYQLKHPQATRIWEGVSTVISNMLIERAEVTDAQMVQNYAQFPTQLQLLNREISRIDLGIKEVQIAQGGSGGTFLLFIHDNLEMPMPLYLESAGTRHFIKLYPMIAQVLSTGGVLLLDEIDASIHPMVLPEILRWFHNPQRNSANAQLWMTCHNASLLDTLVKEEVLFTERTPPAGRRSIAWQISPACAARTTSTRSTSAACSARSRRSADADTSPDASSAGHSPTDLRRLRGRRRARLHRPGAAHRQRRAPQGISRPAAAAARRRRSARPCGSGGGSYHQDRAHSRALRREVFADRSR